MYCNVMEHKCIKSSIEYQILESIRTRLKISPHRLQAPTYEMDDVGSYYRHCRLIVRERGLDLCEMPSPLYLGLCLRNLTIELYFRGGLFLTRRGKHRYFEGNCIYGIMNLCDTKNLSGPKLKAWIKSALVKAGRDIEFKRPLFMMKMFYPTVGPYSND
jgi:hypothetical protein